MDFRVTHFLVADSTATDGLANAVNSSADGLSIEAIPSGRIGVVNPLAANPTILPDMDGTGGSVAAAASGTPIQFVQGLNTADAIEKELGLIKSGIIEPSKILSVRKMVGSNQYSRQVKVVGSSLTTPSVFNLLVLTNNTTVPALGSFYYTTTGIYQAITVTGSGAISALPTPTSLTVAGASSSSYTFAYFPLPTNLPGHAWDATDSSFSTSKVSLSAFSAGDSLSVEADKEYSLSVRMRSSRANTLSPFGLMRGYSAFASNTYVGPTTTVTADKYLGYSVAFNLVKAFALDHQIDEFAKVHAIYTINASTDQAFIFTTTDSLPSTSFISGTQSGATANIINVNNYNTWHEAISGSGVDVNAPGAYVAGTDYKLSFVVEGLEQPMFTNPADLTLFPYKWDFVKLNVFFQEGPYHDRLSFTGNSLVQNAGVTTQTPVVYDRTASGSITSATTPISNYVYIPENYANPIASGKDVVTYLGYLVVQGSGASAYTFSTDVKFPNLTQSEVKYLAHEYQSYSLKYKQQFQGVKYNAMVMDPQQTKVNFNGLYTLYYIEYMPYADFSYTSTQAMPQLTIIAVPQNLSTLITGLDTILSTSPGNVTIPARINEVVS
jgi:hypothetical protein